ncbi:hypothetical protein [Streptomyces halobius]|uniref:Uncharacterized protein n=1 Tax=Streptomyces halobius TaxID=2879846 RepID=A0ABY4MJU2_9ACTN|nr:hypothetical protein [Streptomyces halobius]UQA96671.1 hypothetical protein K9S39_36675 [Streptomyces halobius]
MKSSALLFCLPQSHPVSLETFNYAPVALLVVLALATVWWAVAGRRSYEIPAHRGGDRELAKLEQEIV